MLLPTLEELELVEVPLGVLDDGMNVYDDEEDVGTNGAGAEKTRPPEASARPSSAATSVARGRW